jgi:hypothetical protein
VPGTFRDAVERRSILPLTYLNSLPRAVPFAAMMALLLVGLLVPGVLGFLALVVVAGFLIWLVYIGWPHLTRDSRVLRLLAVVLVLAGAVQHLFAR